MKRVNVYRNKDDKNGTLVAVEDEDILTFKSKIGEHFETDVNSLRLFSSNGSEIKDVQVLRDNENIYLCNNGMGDSKSCENVEKSMQDISLCEQSKPGKAVDDWVTLNVGGKHFTTSRATLTAKEPLSMLARMFAEDKNVYLMNPSATDSIGAYLIDRSPEYFEPILNYLRHGAVILDKYVNPRGVMEEAVFYGIDSMIPQLNQLIEESRISCGINQALTRMDVVRSIIMTPTSSELRFQGVNLSGADLNRLDLRYINFKYACLSRCNLSGANLSHCCLERADLSHANLEGAQLLGLKALCANMEGANLKGCNMEDPAGSRAVMEGVNLKGANLEGSNMAGVNLRVATLKNANLQNCDLRAAVLAGADLECCDLSGSDLHEANLRGANLKDAAFELMLTPLHMSQTIR
ncbi:BTB/POZ domain-containing protein KCTD9-like [Trichoplusia ni]|uniref:BTB/POZ domain-containing protein KCTD9-like n=1 Tax=Trichoplusia ni TaxID=7111 RepID=A0A7E5VN40_TRINI|nr:BTB/POZ domain-containing protein KCTD9-like [Trichoplusia ni]XP_026729749.1 BTB/POZ domain-containing protein KCTD9-like [Trichoplusia ni]